MGDERKIAETAKEYQEMEEGTADSSKSFAEAGHQQRDDSGARVDGGKEATDEPAPGWAEPKTESGVDLFPEGKGPGGS